MSALCRRLKLSKGASLYTLRHSHGSHLLAAGMEITAISERLALFRPRNERRSNLRKSLLAAKSEGPVSDRQSSL